MPKDTMISFRTTDDFSKSLKKLAKKNKVSLSGFIDAVLKDYLESHVGKESLLQERRRFPRQQEIIPAIISSAGSEKRSLHASKITNLSLGGINLIVPKSAQNEALVKDQIDSFEVVFSLPREGKPITIQCQGAHIQQTSDAYQVGATFSDTDLDSYQALQSYLL